MISISGLDNITTTSNESLAENSTTLGKDDFLLLLVTQLKSQDPLNPMEHTEFTAQLAQFGSLEQLYNINGNLNHLESFSTSLNNSLAVNLIGKSVMASGNAIYVSPGHSNPINYCLERDTSGVFVSIYDANGNLVKTIEDHTSVGAGDQSINWDGRDNDRNQLPGGLYNFQIMAVDVQNEMVNATTYTTGKVSGVTYRDDSAYLIIDNNEIAVTNILKVIENDV